MKATIGVASNPGRKRAGANQDTIGVYQPNWLNRRPPLLVLADGMGGHSGGTVASSLVVEAFLSYYRSSSLKQGIEGVLREAALRALASVQARAQSDTSLADMGSTVVAAILQDRKATLVNAGDSRAYVARGEKLNQVSWDHSLVAELVRRGVISAQEALTHPNRSHLTMAISAQRKSVEPYSRQVDLLPGDQVLLCSDGLWAVVPEEQISYFLQNFPPQTAANDLVKQALEYGGPDNISVIVAKLS